MVFALKFILKNTEAIAFFHVDLIWFTLENYEK